MRSYYVTTDYVTCYVDIDDNRVIVNIPPIWKKFKGQRLDALIIWHLNKGKEINLKKMEV